MAHARRKFDEALNNDKERAEYALTQFQKLYKVERDAKEKGLSYEERKMLRETDAIPVLREFETWMKEQLISILPKSSLVFVSRYFQAPSLGSISSLPEIGASFADPSGFITMRTPALSSAFCQALMTPPVDKAGVVLFKYF